jgi:hypothetical protein
MCTTLDGVADTFTAWMLFMGETLPEKMCPVARTVSQLRHRIAN